MTEHRNVELARIGRSRSSNNSSKETLSYEDSGYIVGAYILLTKKRVKRKNGNDAVQDTPERRQLIDLMYAMTNQLKMEYSLRKINILCQRLVCCCCVHYVMCNYYLLYVFLLRSSLTFFCCSMYFCRFLFCSLTTTQTPTG